MAAMVSGCPQVPVCAPLKRVWVQVGRVHTPEATHPVQAQVRGSICPYVRPSPPLGFRRTSGLKTPDRIPAPARGGGALSSGLSPLPRCPPPWCPPRSRPRPRHPRMFHSRSPRPGRAPPTWSPSVWVVRAPGPGRATPTQAARSQEPGPRCPAPPLPPAPEAPPRPARGLRGALSWENRASHTFPGEAAPRPAPGPTDVLTAGAGSWRLPR